MTTTSPKTIIKADISISKKYKTYLAICWISILVVLYCMAGSSGYFEIVFLTTFTPCLVTICIIYGCFLYPISRCSLELTNKGLSGQRKKIFSTIQLQLPMDKIDNIMVIENARSKSYGGKTVSIRSASGLIKFPWVQNADEFVRVTLAEIEKYNQSLKNVDKNLVSAIAGNSALKAQPQQSAAQKIKDLKELLDSGIITQDEFDTKKKDLLDKM